MRCGEMAPTSGHHDGCTVDTMPVCNTYLLPIQFASSIASCCFSGRYPGPVSPNPCRSVPHISSLYQRPIGTAHGQNAEVYAVVLFKKLLKEINSVPAVLASNMNITMNINDLYFKQKQNYSEPKYAMN